MGSSEIYGVIVFMALLLMGISMVSVHYRRRYEKIREIMKIYLGVDPEELEI